jgi:glycerate-2-kinase
LGKEENETLRKNSVLLTEGKNQYVIIANNDQAMEAARERAEQLGYRVILMGCGTGSTDDKIKEEVNREVEKIWKIVTRHTTESDHITFASFSTDGIDGNSDVAGAIADGDTLELARSKGLDGQDYLASYDSASFFRKLGLAIETGPTGTNVADITLVLITNPTDFCRKIALVFGGESTVNIVLPEDQKSGSGGRNTHLALLAAKKLAHFGNPRA